MTRWMAMFLSATCLAAGPGPDTGAIDVVVVDDTWAVPNDFTVRVRVTKITPAEPVAVHWRRKGEGLGGNVVRGAFSETALPVGQWCPPVPVKSLAKGGSFPGKMFLTVTAGRPGRSRRAPDGRRIRVDHSTAAEFEFEFRWAGKPVKAFREAGPDGGTVGVVIPAYRLAGGRRPDDPRFVAELTGLLDYATRRAERLEKLPRSSWPRPRRYAVINNVSGYGQGIGYGIRHTNRAIVAAECRSLRQLGVNGFRSGPEFLYEMIRKRKGFAKDFDRACIAPMMDYPVPSYRAGRKSDPECGCPYAPGVGERTRAGIARSLKALDLPVGTVWGLTVDEIGSVFDRTPEGKGHLGVCPRCAEGFRAFLKAQGRRPADFGKRTWDQVAPAQLWRPREPEAPKSPKPPTGPFDRPRPSTPAKPRPFAPPDLADPNQALLAYETLRFNNYASGRLFGPLRDAIAAANATAGRRRLVSYALRGNTFLMRGHSLDFFDFYRQADNAFVYETSNRGPRIWSWDSYLCDVARCVSTRMHKDFGVYVKPHRGAPIQRMLSAVSRGATMLYWYTYGPDYHKGDSFSQSDETLALTAKAAALLGRCETALYGSRWMHPAEVGIVKPRTSELWMRLAKSPARDAAWENAKWTYTALQHAHLPVDALDETMLATEDLSRYKVLYVLGPNLRRAAASRLTQWVLAGGTLVTSGGGLVRDEANRPLNALADVLGLNGRSAPEMTYQVALYGATRIESYTDPRRRLGDVPRAATVLAPGPPNIELAPVIGREVLRPRAGTKVLAKFADGSAAVTCHPAGKGRAYVVGFFAGLEYSAALRHDGFDMSREFDAALRRLIAAPALARVRPVVDAALPTVEGVLLVHEASGKRAVTLANWAYRVIARRQRGRRVSTVTGLVPAETLRIAIRQPGKVNKVTSAMLDNTLKFTTRRDTLTVELPRLEEGDVLLLE